MALRIYAVRNDKEQGFLITTDENKKKDLEKWSDSKYVGRNYSFIKQLQQQDIIPIFNKNLLKNFNLKAKVVYDGYITYYFFFKEVYNINNFKIEFDIKAKKFEKENLEIVDFLLTLKDREGNEITIDVFDEIIKSINGNEVYDDDLLNKISEILNKYKIYYSFCDLLEKFKECYSSQNIIEIVDIKKHFNIELFINDIKKIIKKQ